MGLTWSLLCGGNEGLEGNFEWAFELAHFPALSFIDQGTLMSLKLSAEVDKTIAFVGFTR